MRKLLTPEMVEENAVGIKKQLSRFLDFREGKALMLNNADWLTKLEYIPFLRDFGRHFSVNRMIKAESYKMRLESEEGLNFIEFNYMLLQAYDFLELYDHHACRLQMGGSDQWGNIVAGIELIRRVRQETAFGITFPLITTSSGGKMGKTAAGAGWRKPEHEAHPADLWSPGDNDWLWLGCRATGFLHQPAARGPGLSLCCAGGRCGGSDTPVGAEQGYLYRLCNTARTRPDAGSVAGRRVCGNQPGGDHVI